MVSIKLPGYSWWKGTIISWKNWLSITNQNINYSTSLNFKEKQTNIKTKTNPTLVILGCGGAGGTWKTCITKKGKKIRLSSDLSTKKAL